MKENKKYIDMNKVIILALALIVIFVSTIIINSISGYKGKELSTNNKNVYASGNKKQNIDNKMINKQEESIKEDNIDDKTIQYFENIELEVDNYVEDKDEKKLSSIAKEKFVTLVDFIFYGTEINGITFNELTDATKEKLVSIVNSIDNKIESKVPGYKEEISDNATTTYTYLSERLKKGITYIDGKIDEKVGTEKYETFKENVSETADKVKEVTSNIVDSGKNVAKNIKDKVKNWYEGWK